MKKLRAIAFDLDDTLYPEVEYVQSGFREVAAWSEVHLGTPAESSYIELQNLFRAGVRGSIFDLWLAAHNRTDPSLVSKLVQIYREHAPTIRPFPEVPSVLQCLKNQYRLGLLSDGRACVQRGKLAALKLSDYFDCVVFCDEWGRDAWKPSVQCFGILVDRLGVPAAEIVYVGDNPSKDFLGARKAGLMTIWIRRPDLLYTNLEPMTPAHAPDTILDSIAGLRTALSVMGKY